MPEENIPKVKEDCYVTQIICPNCGLGRFTDKGEWEDNPPFQIPKGTTIKQWLQEHPDSLCANCGCLFAGVEEKVCTYNLTHSGVCKGKCGCVKCHDEYADFLSSE